MAIIQNFSREQKEKAEMQKLQKVLKGAENRAPSTIDQIRNQFFKSIEGVAANFGAVLGIAKWQQDNLNKAMEQLKGEGCRFCNHRKCEKCQDKSGWAWNAGERHES